MMDVRRKSSGLGGSLFSQPSLLTRAAMATAPTEPRIGLSLRLMSTFIKLRAGLQEHMELGKLTLFDVGVYVSIHFQSNYETGTWIGSAGKILAKCPKDSELRRIQRSIARLEAIGFIKCFRRKHGSRGNFACVINKYEMPFGALKGKRVNAEKSTSYEHIAYDVCADVTVSRRCAVDDVTPIQDVDLEKSKSFLPAKDKRHKTLPAARKLRESDQQSYNQSNKTEVEGTGITPSILDRLNRRELQGLQTTLKRSIPLFQSTEYRDSLIARLQQVETLLAKGEQQ